VSPPSSGLFNSDPSQHDVWPVQQPASAVTDLAGIQTLHLLYREPGGNLIAGPIHRLPPMEQVRGNIPPVLAQLHFRFVNAPQVSPAWILATLTRN
jgi:hypothetical protein